MAWYPIQFTVSRLLSDSESWMHAVPTCDLPDAQHPRSLPDHTDLGLCCPVTLLVFESNSTLARPTKEIAISS